MAGVTRLELATSGVTGQRSNQLSYTPAKSAGGKLMQAADAVNRFSKKFWSFGERRGEKSDPGNRRQGGGGGEPL